MSGARVRRARPAPPATLSAARTVIPKELLAALRTIEIHTARLANEQLSGTYTSSFKGQGLAFREVRPYQPGDDVRQHRLERLARA